MFMGARRDQSIIPLTRTDMVKVFCQGDPLLRPQRREGRSILRFSSVEHNDYRQPCSQKDLDGLLLISTPIATPS